MPTRLVDGDAICGSEKLGELAARGKSDCVAHYEKLLCLAQANGSFEYHVPDITRRFAKILPWMTQEQWSAILIEYERVKLLFSWRTADGKLWGYWTKIELHLPPVSQVRKGYRLGAPVPVDELAKFLGRPVEEVRADLAGTPALLGGRNARATRGAPGEHQGGPRQEEVRNRRGLGWDGTARPALSSSPTAPPQAPGAQEREKKNKRNEIQKKNGDADGAMPIKEGVGSEYALFAVKYREITGRQPGGSDKKRELYRRLCEEFGQEAVLGAVRSWAAQRGGPGRLAENCHAIWDFLEEGQCKAEILGSRGQRRSGDSFEERSKRHREMDETTKRMLKRK